MTQNESEYAAAWSGRLRGGGLRWLWRKVLVASALALGLLVAGATPAQAAAPAGCSSTYFCFYADPNYSGGTGRVAGSNPNFTAFGTSTSNCGNGNWNDCVSSAYNNGASCSVTLFADAGYTGRALTLARGQGYTNLKSVNFDDILSSNRFC